MIGALFILCIVVLSQASTLVRFADAPSLAVCFWRLLFASMIISPIALRPRRLEKLKSLGRRESVSLLLSGFFLFLHLYFYFRAVQETSVATATILYSVSPVTTAIGAYLIFKERVTLHLALSCALGMAGVAVLFGESLLTNGIAAGLTPERAATTLRGDLWAILAAATFSGYILTGKHVRMKLPNALFSMSIYMQTSLYAMIAMLFLKVPFTGYSNQTWLAFLAMACLPTLMGHAIFTYCLNFMNVNFMSCMKLVEPLLSAAAAAWLFGERLTEWAALGFAFTAASVVVLYFEPLVAFARGRTRPRS